MPKVVTVESRRAEAVKLGSDLSAKLDKGTPANWTEADWREIAALAGGLQRKSRQLGGLGRGG